jgi:hypothetical protein
MVMKRSWRRTSNVVMAVGGVLWAAAVLTQCAGDATRATAGVFIAGIALIVVGAWMGGESRRAAITARAEGEPAVHTGWMEQSAPIALTRSERNVGMFEVAFGDGTAVLAGNRMSLGGAEEWHLKVSARRASIGSGRETPATASRARGKPGAWWIDDGTRRWWFERSEDRSVEKTKSSVHLFAKDSHTVTRRRGILAASEGGVQAAVVDLTYALEALMQRKLDGHRDMTGDFSGEIDVRSPVPVPVAVLGLRLTLARWAKDPPRTGTWVQYPNSP